MKDIDGIIAFGLGSVLVILFFTKHSLWGLGNLDPNISLDILTLMGIILALKKYIDEKEDARKRSVSELVSFFRKELILSHRYFITSLENSDVLKEIGKPIQIPLSNPTTEFFQNEFNQKASKQNQYLWKSGISEHSLELTNRLEEFAFKVILLKAKTDPALSILRSSFCQMLEQQAVRIVAQREMISDDYDIYTNSLSLYKFWINLIKSTDSDVNIENFKRKFETKN